jgi:uroporphyrin-III C-methyltransferase/precorrin-2 dehydrogenase/sirohydrochlorin ferrochelatase
MPSVCRGPSEAAPPRIAPLAVLPVFLELAGRRAIVVGGSDAAAWKAELLAAAGARVEVYTDAPGDALRGLLERGTGPGSLTLVTRECSTAGLREAAVVVADLPDRDAAQAFRVLTRAAGVPVNVIDMPELCDFQLGTIVNRSPVVVGISTHGGAPILGQAIRRRIETVLPRWLGAWAALAKELRGRVATRLPLRAMRRRFWERVAERAFLAPPPADASADLARLVDRLEGSSAGGRLTLVGAGPGDPELLTLQAVRALQAAEVTMFDGLVSHEVLELARREANHMLVGKHGDVLSCREEELDALIIRLARQGKHVLRLTFGDPMASGRAADEIENARAAGIPVDVVPGIRLGWQKRARCRCRAGDRRSALRSDRPPTRSSVRIGPAWPSASPRNPRSSPALAHRPRP